MSERVERLPRHVSVEEVDFAEQLLAELLAAGPLRPRDVKAEGRRRGFDPVDDVWQCARRRLGATSTQVGPARWQWALPGHEVAGDVEAEFRLWEESPAGKFETFYVARNRREERIAIGEQLRLDVVDG